MTWEDLAPLILFTNSSENVLSNRKQSGWIATLRSAAQDTAKHWPAVALATFSMNANSNAFGVSCHVVPLTVDGFPKVPIEADYLALLVRPHRAPLPASENCLLFLSSERPAQGASGGCASLFGDDSSKSTL